MSFIYAPYIPLYTTSTVAASAFFRSSRIYKPINSSISNYWYAQLVNGVLPKIHEVDIFHYDRLISWSGSCPDALKCLQEGVIQVLIWPAAPTITTNFLPNEVLCLGAYYIHLIAIRHGHIKDTDGLYGFRKEPAWRLTILPLWNEYQTYMSTLNTDNAGVPHEF